MKLLAITVLMLTSLSAFADAQITKEGPINNQVNLYTIELNASSKVNAYKQARKECEAIGKEYKTFSHVHVTNHRYDSLHSLLIADCFIVKM